ncbi:CAP10 domain-containing protein [Mycena indigotica]|uniref:CAP10 domain-containing protein n=1 Tax=Mycena indigotica TaxID=2126181 RepID=A0A8H6VWY2_9AGAR|nr:CAP10 domain-containing protein [Mycena indigotica]KAF7296912.1 CAP10 domain-containing protein [Mycena indigotica]
MSFFRQLYPRQPVTHVQLPNMHEDSGAEWESEALLLRPGDRQPNKRRALEFSQSRLFIRLALALILVALGLLLALLVPSKHIPRKQTTKPSNVAELETPDFFLPAARDSVAVLRARQSATLAQAAARYTLKTGRTPPRNYDLWFQFAKEHDCLIDEYDQIHRDFKPFYQLAKEDPVFFQRMIDAASKAIRDHDKEMARYEIKDGTVTRTPGAQTAYAGDLPITLGKFAHILPDLTVIINGRDQPRVVFDVRQTGRAIRERALKLTEKAAFDIVPKPESWQYFAKQPGCTIMRSPAGFPEVASGDSAFLISSAKSDFTEDLYPVLSMAKISPCFADILFPIQYYYMRSWWYRKFAYPNNIAWEDKKSQLYWRGIASGGQIVHSNYHNFTRFKVADLSRAHPDEIDAKITSFANELCAPEVCDRSAIVAEYGIDEMRTSKEAVYGYKYLLDVDGTTFSGRFLGLLKSGSLVFKMTLFEEYFNGWLRPYEHYIPVASDLSDLLEKLAWAKENEAEARLIQERGREMTEQVMTDEQNDCYFSLVLLEWARLQEISRNATGFH